MRLPVSEVYRAFPELDEFSDAQCRGYMKTVRRRHWLRLASSQLGAAGLGLVVGVAVVTALASVGGVGSRSPLLTAVYLGGAVLPFTLPLVAALLVRDRVLRTLLRRQLDTASCGACGYSLLGLPVEAGRVTCPECGEAHELERMGLRAEDLLAERAPE